MLKIFKRELNLSIVTSLIFIALGVVIIAYPEKTIDITNMVFAALAIISGAVISIINIANFEEQGNLVFGILLVVIGIALLIYPNSINILIALGLGIWFISSSVNRIRFAVLLKKVQSIKWIKVLVSAIFTLAIGISFVFMPLASTIALTTVSGVLMIIYALIDLFGVFFIKKHMKTIETVLG